MPSKVFFKAVKVVSNDHRNLYHTNHSHFISAKSLLLFLTSPSKDKIITFFHFLVVLQS